ncbi:MAG TPA: hypothetical protein VFT60_08620 [Bryobacteraceae bacterium]|nr:hypothetical protein [Bryobacteraceae bacterium]
MNIAIGAWFVKLVSGSDRLTAFAALLFAFHPRLIDAWFRTAVIYDLLCFLFVYLALCLYIAGRAGGRNVSGARAAGILLCYAGALGSKEMAVVLPVFLLAWELLFGRLRWRNGWLIAVTAAVNAIYFLEKTRGADAMILNPAYRPEYSFAQFQQSWGRYIGQLLLRPDPIPAAALAILAALLVIALAFRSRRLIFAWIVIVTAMLPVSFVPPRSGYVMYVSYIGWCLYAATILVAIQDAIVRRWSSYRTAVACVFFALVAWRFGKINLHAQRVEPRRDLFDEPALVRSTAMQFMAMRSGFPAGSRILLLRDPYPASGWTPYFIVRLLYHDKNLTVDRPKMMNGAAIDLASYQYVFDYYNGRFQQMQPDAAPD